MNNLQDFVDLYAEPDETLKADGFDDAITLIKSDDLRHIGVEWEKYHTPFTRGMLAKSQ